MTKALKSSARIKARVVAGQDRRLAWRCPMAPPEEERANEAVIEMLSERLGLSADAVTVVSGHSAPSKVVTINGMDDEMIKTAIRQQSSSVGKTKPPDRPSRNSVGWSFGLPTAEIRLLAVRRPSHWLVQYPRP